MSTTPINYETLAAQARGGDYAALAEQARGGDKGFLESFGYSSGITPTAKALIHPIDAVMGLGALAKQSAANIIDAYHAVRDHAPDAAQRVALAVPIAGPIAKTMSDQALEGNTAGALGTYLGVGAGVALSKLFPKAVRATPAAVETAANATARGIEAAGDATEAAGMKLVNETVGSYKSDFNRGANPGRGYLNNKLGVTLSMRSLANKAEAAQQTVGRSIQRVISGSSAANAVIPVNDVLEALSKPLKDAYDSETAPGGMGNTAPYEQYAQGFKDTIQNGIRKGGFTAQEVFDLKRQIAKKAKFNSQTPEGILDVRQSQVGALGGLLTKQIPELADLNQSYQDLVKISDRAQWRAESGAMPFRRGIREAAKAGTAVAASAVGGAHEGLGAYALLSALDSTAGRTGLATTLYNGGRGLSAAGTRLQELLQRGRQ